MSESETPQVYGALDSSTSVHPQPVRPVAHRHPQSPLACAHVGSLRLLRFGLNCTPLCLARARIGRVLFEADAPGGHHVVFGLREQHFRLQRRELLCEILQRLFFLVEFFFLLVVTLSS